MKIYVVFEEPEYEGGGSYYGARAILDAFTKKEDALEYCKRSETYDWEEVTLHGIG